MEQEYDIYISYSTQDNESSNTHIGWIDSFQKFLDILLDQILGQKAKFLCFSNQEKPSAAQLVSTKVLICVLSPSYINSGYCIEDIDIFSKTNNNSPDKIFKVVKSPILSTEEPSSLRGLVNYNLFHLSKETGEITEVYDFFSPQFEKTFWMRLIDLAYKISEALGHNNASITSKETEKPTIYLGNTSYDLSEERNYIQRELQRHGYRVLPDRPFPSNTKELEAVIRKNLEQSRLSIHLIGDVYGEILPNSNISLTELESRIAVEYSNVVAADNEYKDSFHHFNRLIWISPETRKNNERQNEFIEKLIKDADTLEGAEVLQTPIEDLKFVIRKELLSSSIKKKFSRVITNKSKLYFLYDKVDIEQSKPMIKFFKGLGLDLLTPAFEGELLEIHQRHIENLKTCDAAIIHFGKVNEQWVKMKLFDLLKAPGFGRKKPVLAKAIYACNGAKINYDYYNNFDVDIVESDSSFIPESFQLFLEKLEK